MNWKSKKDSSTETIACKDGACTVTDGSVIRSEPGCAECRVNAPAAK